MAAFRRRQQSKDVLGRIGEERSRGAPQWPLSSKRSVEAKVGRFAMLAIHLQRES